MSKTTFWGARGRMGGTGRSVRGWGCVCLVNEARGGVESPELAGDGGRSSEGVWRNSSSLGAERGRRVRGNGEEARAFKRVWSGGIDHAALKRIDDVNQSAVTG